MTSDQAYDVVFQFLDQFWKEHKKEYDDDLPDLLSSMDKTIWTDRMPGDPAYTQIWQECSDNKTEMAADDAFETLIKLLEGEISIGQGAAQDIGRLLAEIRNNTTRHRKVFDEIVRVVTT